MKGSPHDTPNIDKKEKVENKPKPDNMVSQLKEHQKQKGKTKNESKVGNGQKI